MLNYIITTEENCEMTILNELQGFRKIRAIRLDIYVRIQLTLKLFEIAYALS